MLNTLQKNEILDRIPHQEPFRFIDDILEIDNNSICGEYTYKENEFFYKGHFPDFPVTPGVILTETMAQIGLLALGIFLSKESQDPKKVFMTSSNIDFRETVLPGEKVIVKAKKIFFRLNKLKCEVSMHHEEKGLICKGTISGIFIQKKM